MENSLPLKYLTDRTFFGFFGLMNLSVLAVSLVLEHGFDIPGCRLCVLERYPYKIAAFLCFILYVFYERPFIVLLIKRMLFISFLAGVLLSMYHIGIQNHWIELPEFCKGHVLRLPSTLEELKSHILAQPPLPSCDQIPLRILGLSLAEWNLILSLGCLGLMSYFLRKK